MFNLISSTKQPIEFSDLESLVGFIKSSKRDDLHIINKLRTDSTLKRVDKVRLCQELYKCTFTQIINASNTNNNEGILYFRFDKEHASDLDFTYIQAYWTDIFDNEICAIVYYKFPLQIDLQEIQCTIAEQMGLIEYTYSPTISIDFVSYDSDAYCSENRIIFEIKDLQPKLDSNLSTSLPHYGVDTSLYEYDGGVRFDNAAEQIAKLGLDSKDFIDFGLNKLRFTKCFVPFKTITDDSKRIKYLESFAKCLLALNPKIEDSQYRSFVEGYNKKYFEQPLYEDKVCEIIYETNKLKGKIQPYNNQTKRFNFEEHLNTKERRQICMKIINGERSQHTFNQLMVAVENWDYDKYPKITGKNLKEVSGKNKKTVDKYYPKIREYLNNKLSEQE